MCAVGNAQLIQPTISTVQIYIHHSRWLHQYNTLLTTCLSHWRDFELNMEHSIKLAFLMVTITITVSSPIPYSEYNIDLMQKSVNCVSNFKPNTFCAHLDSLLIYC